jgi:hypothetical protein
MTRVWLRSLCGTSLQMLFAHARWWRRSPSSLTFSVCLPVCFSLFVSPSRRFRIHIGDTGGVSLSEHELDALAEMTEGWVSTQLGFPIRSSLTGRGH